MTHEHLHNSLHGVWQKGKSCPGEQNKSILYFEQMKKSLYHNNILLLESLEHNLFVSCNKPKQIRVGRSDSSKKYQIYFCWQNRRNLLTLLIFLIVG